MNALEDKTPTVAPRSASPLVPAPAHISRTEFLKICLDDHTVQRYAGVQGVRRELITTTVETSDKQDI